MGYESKLFVVEKGNYKNNDGRVWGEIIAMFDCCKFYALSDVLRKCPKTDCYIYIDGENETTEDLYGEALTEATPQIIIPILEKELANGHDYRRTYPLLAMLKSFDEHKEQWGNLVVLHYGY